MAKLFYHDKPIIGLDISQTGIKIMSIDSKRWLVLGYGSVDLDPVKMQESLKSNDDYLANNIKSLLSEGLIGNLASDHVAIGIPTSRTFSRTFKLPIKSESTLSDAVQVEVDQYIPVPFSSLYVDYKIIERNKENATTIMCAIPKLLIDSCIKAVNSAGLRPVVIEPGINATARILEITEEAQLTTLIIDIGSSGTDIAIFDNGAIRITGGISIGGNTFTLEIAKKLGTTVENAHQLKVLSGLSAGPRQAKIVGALKPSLQKILSESRKVIRYYNERISDSSKIAQVLIVGGGSNVPGIGDYFTNDLIMAARVASPWQKLDFGKLPQPNKHFRPRYISVSGLAIINPQDVLK